MKIYVRGDMPNVYSIKLKKFSNEIIRLGHIRILCVGLPSLGIYPNSPSGTTLKKENLERKDFM